MSRILGAQPEGAVRCAEGPSGGLAERGHKVDGQGSLETIQMSINMGTDTYIAVQSHTTDLIHKSKLRHNSYLQQGKILEA